MAKQTKAAKAAAPVLQPGQWNLIGHEWAVEHLSRSIKHNRLRQAYLITGAESIGKTTFARAFAQTINCQDSYFQPCNKCRACLLTARGQYADVRIIEPDGNTMKIEQVRDFQHQLSLRPVEAHSRILILRKFHRATSEAMDALLKTLEEPPASVVLILTADSSEALLPTIRSRCQPIHLRTLPIATVRQALQTHFHAEPEQAALIAQLSGGRIGWAIRALADEVMLSDRADWLTLLEQALSASRSARFALVEPLGRERAELLKGLDLWQSYWRDVLLRYHSTGVPVTNRDHAQTIQQLAVGLKAEDVLRVISAIRRTMTYVEANVNPRLALEVLMLDLPHIRLIAAPPS